MSYGLPDRLNINNNSTARAIVLRGIANLIDRVFRDGHVVVYMVLNVGPAHTGAFNIADIAITVGALYLLADLLMKPRNA